MTNERHSVTKLMLVLQLLAATLFAVILQTSENRIRSKTLLFRASFFLAYSPTMNVEAICSSE
jgi:hypothetical protein